MPRASTLPQLDTDTVILGGGLDQMTPDLEVHPGRMRRSVNYECPTEGGYRRIVGYERYDGHISPSSVTFRVVPVVAFIAAVNVGEVVAGSTSGTSATVIAVGANYVAVTAISGPGFQVGEILTVAGTVVAEVEAQIVRLSKSLKKQYINLAADVYRALIQKVPGTGPVRGVFGATLMGTFAIYALRDQNDGNCYLFKSTTSGWIIVHGFPDPISTKFEVNFTDGGDLPIPNDTVCTEDPGIIAKRVVLTSGAWEDGSATGKIIYTTTTANMQQGTVYTFGSTTVTTTIAGADFGAQPYLFKAGGKFEFDFANFYGRQNQARIYGCDGRNRCWEFDGEIVIPIDIGVATTGDSDLAVRPTHIKEHHLHLFVSDGSSALNSAITNPFDWTPLHGAAEYAQGDRVTGFQVLAGVQGAATMAITSRNKTKILYGTAAAGAAPFQLIELETETGALPYTIQRLDRMYYLDDRGVVDLKTVQEYGNFAAATSTRNMQTYMDQKHGRAACSMLSRAKSQYRLFFSDGTGLFMTFAGGKFKGAGPVHFPTPMFCAWSGENSQGTELAFAGGIDGYVYQFERGTSFDGEPIVAELVLAWNAMKTPRLRKNYHHSSIEMKDCEYTELRVGKRLGPQLIEHLQDEEIEKDTSVELNMQWDHFVWDNFWWDSHGDLPIEVDVKGTSERIQFILGSGTDYLPSYTLTSITTAYFKRRMVRGKL